MSSPITCESISKSFRCVSAIKDLRLEVPEGSIYALIGANGAGKTTLIKLLVNILRPSKGHCLVLGKNTTKLSPNEYAQIGYVSENQELPGWMTLDYFLRFLKPFYPNWDDGLVTGLIGDFELPRDRKLGEFSRGMKMKASLVSSLAFHPRLILLDEPFSGLDALVRDELIEGLLERAAGTTILVSSHDLAEVESFASHVGYMASGKVQCSEETATLHDRYREIEIATGATPQFPSSWPDNWSKPQMSAAAVRFVESRFHPDETRSAISQCFPGAVNVSISPMPLREIFVSLARASRRAAE